MRESTRHRHAFERYVRLGAKRSIERLHEVMSTEDQGSPSIRTLYDWSSKLQWQQRLDELEQAHRQLDRELFIAERRDAHRRHINISVLLQQKGVEWLDLLDERAVSGQAAIRALREGVRMERELLDWEAETLVPPKQVFERVITLGPGPPEFKPPESMEKQADAPE